MFILFFCFLLLQLHRKRVSTIDCIFLCDREVNMWCGRKFACYGWLNKVCICDACDQTANDIYSTLSGAIIPGKGEAPDPTRILYSFHSLFPPFLCEQNYILITNTKTIKYYTIKYSLSFCLCEHGCVCVCVCKSVVRLALSTPLIRLCWFPALATTASAHEPNRQQPAW